MYLALAEFGTCTGALRGFENLLHRFSEFHISPPEDPYLPFGELRFYTGGEGQDGGEILIRAALRKSKNSPSGLSCRTRTADIYS